MNLGILALGCLIPVTRMCHRESSLICLISLDMVCSLFPMLTSNMANGLAELSIAPAMNSRLIPPHARPALEARGIDIDNFTPLTKDEMMARLD